MTIITCAVVLFEVADHGLALGMSLEKKKTALPKTMRLQIITDSRLTNWMTAMYRVLSTDLFSAFNNHLRIHTGTLVSKCVRLRSRNVPRHPNRRETFSERCTQASSKEGVSRRAKRPQSTPDPGTGTVPKRSGF